ncbi:MAG: hypothetical protein KDE19_14915 [Caldilineaceae bacterium]|nr:hypothetical protein [Caldilineaceae bacterium]
MIRLGLAVIAGFVLWSALWLGGSALVRAFFADAVAGDGSVSDRRLLLLLLLLALIASIGAGYLALLVAQATGLRAAWILGVLLLVVGIGVQSQYWAVLPLWYHLNFLILLLPATLLGGWLRM